jgi:prepilin-type N-terminal cleavage/methylation domain-containing protein
MRGNMLPYIDSIVPTTHNLLEFELRGYSCKRARTDFPKGFSLLEALMVLAILALAGAAAIPDLIKWRSQMRLRAAAVELKENLELAKVLAGKENKYIYVKFVPAEGKYHLSYKDPDNNFIPIKEERLPQDVIIDKTHEQYSVHGDQTGFNSRGGADNCTIVLSNLQKKSRLISISPIGKVKLKDG